MKEKVLKPAIVLMIGIIMTQCLVLSYNPIATGFFAAAFAAGPLRYLILPAMLPGIYFAMGTLGAAKYGLIMISIIFCTKLYERKNGKVTPFACGVICGAGTLVMEVGDTLLNATNAIGLHVVVPDVMLGVLAFSLAILFSYGIKAFYRPAAVSHIRNEEMVCIGTLLGIFSYFLCVLNNLPVSSVEIFIYFSILFGGYKYGAGMGAITGAACGLVVGAVSGMPELMGIMCALGILAGAFRELGRLGSSIGFLTGVAALELYFNFGMSEISNIESVFTAVIVFLILPKRLVMRSARAMGEENSGVLQVPLHNSEKINNVAKSLELLADSIEKGVECSRDDMPIDTGEMICQVSDIMCQNCGNKGNCWRKDNNDTYRDAEYLFETAKNNGAISIEDVPYGFTKKCININEFILEVNHLFERARLNMVWQNKLIDNREAVAAGLQEMSGIIDDFSRQTYNIVSFEEGQEDYLRKRFKNKKIILKKIKVFENSGGRYEVKVTLKTEKGLDMDVTELLISDFLGREMRAVNRYAEVGKEYVDLDFVEKTNFTVTYGAAKKARVDTEVSGDNFGFLDVGTGQVLISISDGMGSGVAAYNDSEVVIELLEQMLESGFKEDAALKLINTVMMLNNESGAPATIDLGIIDLYSGVCNFVKSGAACTFIKRGNWVECIRSTTMPVGVLYSVDMENVSKKLYDGDIVIMISDGIVESMPKDDRETVLSRIIMETDEDNPKALSNAIMNKAVKISGGVPKDDMTVLVTSIWDNT